jgi:hypothetical protein
VNANSVYAQGNNTTRVSSVNRTNDYPNQIN